MRRSGLKVWGTIGSLVLALLGTARAGAAETEDAVRETIIRAAYERLSQFTQGSKTQVQFGISDVRTYERRELAGLHWVDLVTMPSGRMVDMVRTVERNSNRGATGVFYDPSWGGAAEAWQPGAKESAEMTVLDLFQVLAGEKPEMGQVLAVTSYAVTATLAGEERAYRAAFVWLPSSLASYTFVVADNITEGVEEAAREILPPTARGAILDANRVDQPPGGGGGDDGGGAGQCVPEDHSFTQNGGYQSGTNGHLFGDHHSSAQFQFVCSCSSSCGSTCTGTVSSKTCAEEGGFTDMCHRMVDNVGHGSSHVVNGNVDGAACAAGYGCVQKACLFCLCGLSVTVNVYGVSVTFASSGDEWSGNSQSSTTCGACIMVPPPPPGDGGGGGGDSGGGGGAGGGGDGCGSGAAYDFDCGNDGFTDYIGICVGSGSDPADVGCALCYGTFAQNRAAVAECAGSGNRASGPTRVTRSGAR